MKTTNPISLTYFCRITVAAALLWSIAVIFSAAWNVAHEHAQTVALAQKEALANFNKDLAFRLWGTKHGGVYVPPTGETPPNPYLSHIPDRDLTLPSGKRLTLMNPAYMLRQLMADFDEFYGIKGRITSLKPLNPGNAPDAWEREALAAFEKGAKDFLVMTEDGGEKNLRLMRPLVVQAGCLKCHAQQGYKEGDIRGGVGVNVPMAPYLALEKKTTDTMILSHLFIWLLGSAVLCLVFYKGKNFILEQVRSEEALRESEERFRKFFNLAPLPLCFVNKEGGLVYINDRFVQVFGYTLEDVPSLKEWWRLAYPDEEYRAWVLKTWEAAVAKAAAEGTDIESIEYTVTCKNGAQRNILTGGITLEESFLAMFIDLTERKQAERRNALMLRRFKALWEISRMLDADLKSISKTTQEKIIEITDSQYAFHGFMNQDETVLTITSWSKEAMAACAVADKPIEYPLAESGLWGNAVRERRTIIINDYEADQPGKRGLPEGHLTITRLMVVPVFENKRLTAVAAVANKEADYTEEDARQIEGILSSVNLLVERKKAQEALSAREAQLKEAQRIAQLGSWELDLHTNTLFWSDEIYRIFEIEPLLFGATYETFLNGIHPGDRERVNRAYVASLETKTPYEIEHRLLMKDGGIKFVHERCETKFDSNGRPLRSLGTMQDVTFSKKAEAKIRQLNEELERRVAARTQELEEKTLEVKDIQRALMNIVEDLNHKTAELVAANCKLQDVDRLKSMFIASMSHELRTPLNSIIGFSSIVLDEWLGPLNDGQKEKLAIVLRTGKHLLALINDLIDISKIEAGKLESTSEEFDLFALITEAAGISAADIAAKGVALEVEAIHLSMQTDRRRLYQCVVNLLANAAKFTRQGRITLKAAQVEGQDGLQDREMVAISVSDTGIGIKEEDLPKLFSSFVRLTLPEDMQVKGTGLGLYLVKKIAAEILGGAVSVTSVHGQGSEFCLTVPVQMEKT